MQHRYDGGGWVQVSPDLASPSLLPIWRLCLDPGSIGNQWVVGAGAPESGISQSSSYLSTGGVLDLPPGRAVRITKTLAAKTLALRRS